MLNRILTQLQAEADKYFNGNPANDRNIQLKIDHTLRVADEVANLAGAENFTPEQKQLALRAALLHDISRFEQFNRFGSFKDSPEFDHGERSAELIDELGLDTDLEPAARRAVREAVRLHNKPQLPADTDPLALAPARAVRDGDKLDILNYLLDNIDKHENESIILSLDRTLRCSPQVLEAVRNRRPTPYSAMRTVSDFTLNMMFWIRDLNFIWSRKQFAARDYLTRLRNYLPPGGDGDELLAMAQSELSAMTRR